MAINTDQHITQQAIDLLSSTKHAWGTATAGNLSDPANSSLILTVSYTMKEHKQDQMQLPSRYDPGSHTTRPAANTVVSHALIVQESLVILALGR